MNVNAGIAAPLPHSAVRLRSVSKHFPRGKGKDDTPALSGIDLTVGDGEFVSIVGPSGCGKSTLLRLIAGLIAPNTGTVERPPGAVGFVFQNPTLMPWATAAANVALPLELTHKPGAEAVHAALGRVGLASAADAYPHQLSGGMQMRVSIARAIVTGPSLLLMDEPFAALDEFTRFRLNDDLLALWKENRWTVVFVTHSVREAVFLSERVIVLSAHPGRIVAEVPIALPSARAPELRLTHAFADQCAAVTAALAQHVDQP